MGLLEAIYESGFATWIRESPSLFAYTLVLSLHAIGLAIVVGISSIVALRVLGVAPGIALRPASRLFPLMYLGLTINALSGLALLAANALNMFTSLMFGIKMVFVVIAVVFVEWTRKVVFDPDIESDIIVIDEKAIRLAWATLISWTLAIVAGRLTSYPYLTETWFGF